MLSATIVFLALVALNIWASSAVLRDSLSSSTQKCVQGLIIWLFPFVGAFFALYTRRQTLENAPDTTWEPVDGGDSGLEELGRMIARSRHQETIDLVHLPHNSNPPSDK
jgi:hypothetical protein